MEQNVIELSAQELISGMIIAKDVVRNDNILLREGSIVNDESIERLKSMLFLDKIQVYIASDFFEQNSKEAKMKKIEKVFEEVSDKLQNLYSEVESLNKESVEDLREFAWKIENQLKNSEIIVNNLLFNGSGDDCIYRHAVNVSALSALIGKWVGIESSKINLLIYSALLHDFGITKLKEEYQKQPDLTLINDTNYEEIKEHVKIAYKSIEAIPNLEKEVAYGVLMHHERCDGSGYPLKVKGEKIHPFAKIIAIADEIDVLNSNKEKKGAFNVLKEIKLKSLNKLDYKYSKIFLDHMCNFYIGEEVKLNNGEVAKILQMNIDNIESPLLLKDGEFIDLKSNSDLYIKELI